MFLKCLAHSYPSYRCVLYYPTLAVYLCHHQAGVRLHLDAYLPYLGSALDGPVALSQQSPVRSLIQLLSSLLSADLQAAAGAAVPDSSLTANREREDIKTTFKPLERKLGFVVVQKEKGRNGQRRGEEQTKAGCSSPVSSELLLEEQHPSDESFGHHKAVFPSVVSSVDALLTRSLSPPPVTVLPLVEFQGLFFEAAFTTTIQQDSSCGLHLPACPSPSPAAAGRRGAPGWVLEPLTVHCGLILSYLLSC